MKPSDKIPNPERTAVWTHEPTDVRTHERWITKYRGYKVYVWTRSPDDYSWSVCKANSTKASKLGWEDTLEGAKKQAFRAAVEMYQVKESGPSDKLPPPGARQWTRMPSSAVGPWWSQVGALSLSVTKNPNYTHYSWQVWNRSNNIVGTGNADSLDDAKKAAVALAIRYSVPPCDSSVMETSDALEGAKSAAISRLLKMMRETGPARFANLLA